MGAARFVGRVGGLAVALGVGAGIFSGAGVASADRSAPDTRGSAGSAADSDSSQASAPARGRAAAGRAASAAETAVVAQTNTSRVAAPVNDAPVIAPVAAAEAAPEPVVEAAVEPAVEPTPEAVVEPSTGGPDPLPAVVEAPDAVAYSGPGPVEEVVVEPKVIVDPVVEEPETATPGEVNDVVMYATGGTSDGADSGPSLPVDSSLADIFLASFVRRELLGTSASDAPAAQATTSAVTKNGVTVDPTVYYFDGILQGNLNATSAGGNELTYKFVDSSDGGKITIGNVPAPLPGSGAQSFTLVPYATWIDPAKPTPNPTPSGTQTFNVRVSEVTPFDKIIIEIPLVGMIAAPVIDLMQATPFIGDLLSPIIGGSVVAEISADVGALVPAGKPVAFTYKVNSFDGTPISMNFFPASEKSLIFPGNYQATLFNGPGLGAPGNTDPYGAYQAAGSTPGLALMRGQGLPAPFDSYPLGFNVITWDPRGEYASGGVLQLDNPFYEGRDVSSLIDWATANTPLLQEGGQPSIGMIGGSYGGGIQMTTVDPRIKAIVPAIAWNSLNQSLYPDDVFKTAWANTLALALVEAGATVNQEIPMGILTGNLFGWLSETAQAALASSGPTSLLSKIDIPAMFVQGTVDALFPLQQAVVNAETIGVDPDLVRMIWFCGGHGVCLDPVDPVAQATSIFTDNMLWLNAYVKDYLKPVAEPLVEALIPTFQWWDQAGTHYASQLMPFADGFQSGTVSATSTGDQLTILPWAWLGSGPNTQDCTVASACQWPLNNTFATKAKAALDVPITVPKKGTNIVGAPTVSFDYSGWGTSKAVYAQIVDDATGRVLGNIVTPIPVTLDGKSHTVTAEIADIAYTAPADGSTLTLQIVGGATLYMNGAIGGVNISNVKVGLPTTTAAVPV